jgi:integrase
MSTHSKVNQRKTYKSPRTARAYLLYTRDEVETLYSVARSTVYNWQKYGLASVAGSQTFFEGQALNHFHRQRKISAKRPCRFFELYCVSCKNKHSLLIEDFTVIEKGRNLTSVVMQCPDRTGRAMRRIWHEDLEKILLLKSESSTHSSDYDAAPMPAESGRIPDLKSAPMNPLNAQALYDFQNYLLHAKGLALKTVVEKLRHVRQFLMFLDEPSLHQLDRSDIIRYKEWRVNEAGEEDVPTHSPSTIVHALGAVADLLEWLINQPGYRRMRRDLPSYCSPSKRLSKLAQQVPDKFVPTMQQVRHVIVSMPASTWEQRRNRALLALLLLTGARDGAAVSLRIKHVDIARMRIFQDATEVKTKASKTIMTDWLPVGRDVENFLIDWFNERKNDGAQDCDPLFPKSPSVITGTEISKDQPWQSTDSLRKFLKRACEGANVPHFKPHAIRSTVARFGEEISQSLEELKAFSQNLSHDSIVTTQRSYSYLDDERKSELMRSARERQYEPRRDDIVLKFRQAPELTQQAIAVLLGMDR